eukprot:8847948-Heterocapsa_arctica.AAC.1
MTATARQRSRRHCTASDPHMSTHQRHPPARLPARKAPVRHPLPSRQAFCRPARVYQPRSGTSQATRG